MNWADLETSLDEAPLFHVDPTDRDKASEDDRQAEFVRRARALGLKVAATPNERKWGLKAWNRAKRLGVEWGHADVTVGSPGPLLAYIEFKNGTKQPEQHQIDWLNSRHRMGFPVAVCRTADSALAFLSDHGFPIAEARHAA